MPMPNQCHLGNLQLNPVLICVSHFRMSTINQVFGTNTAVGGTAVGGKAEHCKYT